LIFSAMRSNLLEELRRRILNGEFTERSLARRIGVSQPHVHNVLAGVRTLSIELADHIVIHLEIPMGRLLPVEQGQAIRRIISSIQR
jgi:transcriptional regulator with XRE-family HTH domain